MKGTSTIQKYRSQVNIKPPQCQKCITTKDMVQSKIQKTNKLIENLQKTLDEIRYRTKASVIAEDTEIVDSKTKKAVEITENTDNRTEQESDSKNNAASVSELTDASSWETESPSLLQQAPNTTPEESHAEIERITIEEPKSSDEHVDSEDDDITIDLFRPKTRRTCGCRKKAIGLTDKFRTAPEGKAKEMDDFEILKAKLDAIIESADSDDSIVEGKPSEAKMEGPRVSFAGSTEWTFRDFMSTEPSTASRNVSTVMSSVSTAAGSSQTENTHPILVQKNTNNFEISPKKPQLELCLQMLPPLNIRREPVAQELINFFIDAQGQTHVTFKNDGCNVGFFEMQSPSLVEVNLSDYTDILSILSKIQDKKLEENVEAADNSLVNRSPGTKPPRTRKQRALSDTFLNKDGGFQKCSSDGEQHGERRRVLQSYQLLDNKNRHDPGLLSGHSMDAISTIDEDVYKTYINPKGFKLTSTSVSVYSTPRQKSATQEKVPSMKSLNKASQTGDSLEFWERTEVLQSYQLLDNNNQHVPSDMSTISLNISAIDDTVYKTYINPKGKVAPPITFSIVSAHKSKTSAVEKLAPLNEASGSEYGQKKMKTKLDKSIQADLRTYNDKTESSSAPKLYNIGLYKSISTQIASNERRKEMKERKSEEGKKEKREKKDAPKERRKEMEQRKLEEEKKGERERKEKKEEKHEREDKNPEEAEKMLPLHERFVKHQTETEKNAQREHKEIEKGVDRVKETQKKSEEKEIIDEEQEEIEMVVKHKPFLDEVALKEQREREKNAKREERKGKEKSEKREKEDYEKRDVIQVVSPGLLASSTNDEPKVAKSSISYERISLSISYSTDESIITECSSEFNQIMSEERKHVRHPSKFGSYSRGGKESQTFKDLREKITKEHALERIGSVTLSDEEEDEISVPNFISGLLDTSTASIKKVIPHIRRSVRVAKSDIRHSLVLGKSPIDLVQRFDEETTEQLPQSSIESRSPKSQVSPEKKTRKFDDKTSKRSSPPTSRKSSDDGNDEKELRNHNYHVSPVHVQGDFIPAYRRMVKPPEYTPLPLRVGRNGRYEDEEDMFCESNSPKFENSLHRRFRVIPKSLYKNKFNLDSSNSDTVTNTDRASSEGEVRCECSVSIGEMHACRRRRSPPRFQRQSLFSTGEHSAGIRKRRTYFNNWVTYYVNKNAMSVNDSSSTS